MCIRDSRRRILPFKTYIEQTAHVVYVKQTMECTALCQTEAQSLTLCKVLSLIHIYAFIKGYESLLKELQAVLCAVRHVEAICRCV